MKLDFRQSAEMTENSPEAYEKLLLDCLNGDSTNFSHWDEVAQSWRIVDIIRHAWDKQTFLSLIMPLAQWVQAAFDLLEKDGFTWEWQPDNWYRDRGQLDQ